MHEQRIGMNPGLCVCVVAVRVNGPVSTACVMPLDSFGVARERFGELDPHGIAYREGRPVMLVFGPHVARDGVKPASGGECGFRVQHDFDAFVPLFGVGDNRRRKFGACGERPVVLYIESVALDHRDNGKGRVARHVYAQALFGKGLVKDEVRHRQRRNVLVTLLVAVHDVARLDSEGERDERVLLQVGAADVLARTCGKAREYRGGQGKAHVLVGVGGNVQQQPGIGGETLELELAQGIGLGVERLGIEVDVRGVLVRDPYGGPLYRNGRTRERVADVELAGNARA